MLYESYFIHLCALCILFFYLKCHAFHLNSTHARVIRAEKISRKLETRVCQITRLEGKKNLFSPTSYVIRALVNEGKLDEKNGYLLSFENRQTAETEKNGGNKSQHAANG